MPSIFQQNLRKKTAFDPDAEFQDGASDATPSMDGDEYNRVTQLPVVRESLIAADLIVEGKIEDKGNVRAA